MYSVPFVSKTIGILYCLSCPSYLMYSSVVCNKDGVLHGDEFPGGDRDGEKSCPDNRGGDGSEEKLSLQGLEWRVDPRRRISRCLLESHGAWQMILIMYYNYRFFIYN